MTDDGDVAAIAALLEDDCARTILAATKREPMTATELSEHCTVSPSTVYRRLESLQDHGLVAERTRLDEDGHHPALYAATLDRVTFEVRAGRVAVTVERSLRERLADSFTDIVEEF